MTSNLPGSYILRVCTLPTYITGQKDGYEPVTQRVTQTSMSIQMTCPGRCIPGRRQSKTPILSRNVDQNRLEIEFLIAICRHTDDKWQSKTLFLSIFDLRSSIVDSVFDCRLPRVK